MQFETTAYYERRARSILGDVVANAGDTSRWKSTDLLDFLNDGIEDIASSQKLMKHTKVVELEALKADYDFTDFAYEITRIEYTPKGKLTFTSRHFLDRRLGKSWLSEIGTPIRAVFDKSDVGKLRFYPIPDNKQFKVVNLEADSAFYGEVTSVLVDGVETPLEDMITAVPPTATIQVLGDYGIAVLESAELAVPYRAKLFYDAKMPIYVANDIVEVDSRLKRPLIDYIVSEALALGIDSENRDLAIKYRKKFDSRIAELNMTAINSGGDAHAVVPYNNGFNLERDTLEWA